MSKNLFLNSSAVLVFLAMITFFSCSTKKNTFTRRVYHNLTAHYNAYFNGKEALKEGKNELAKKNKDNYLKVLPVFELGNKTDAQSVYNLFDRSIDKASIVIQRHSIYIKGVEYIKWIDDAFMLIGKSHYYKQDYELASQTFNYVLNKYKTADTRFEAIIWKARVLTQQGKYEEAEAVLQAIEKKIEKNKTNRAAEKMFPLAMADVLIKQEKFDEAIEFLHQGFRLNKARPVRTRLCFILAQVYQRSGKSSQASKYFRKVLGMNPVYDMEFAAKINLAKSYEVTQGGSHDIKKLLVKMLRDEKNIDYLDQIHYAMAEVYLKENDEERAIKHLKKSAQKSVSNDYQKAISYLKLGDLYFDKPDYPNAQMFYDSCVMVLPKDFPNYLNIESKKNILNDLVKNLNIVALEDSLQMLSRLSPAERDKKIAAEIAQIIKEEERKKLEEQQRLQNQANMQPINQINQATGSWYFYNPSSMSFGYNEFIRKWGKRKYEDLWRLSNKTVTEFKYEDIVDDSDSSDLKDEKNKENDLKNPKTYLAKIPSTPEATKLSNLKIAEALYNIGVIYKEYLNEPEKSIDAFKKLENRFPEHKQIPSTFYNLYQVYNDLSETTKAENYKNLILSKFPDSDFANILRDPDYHKKIEAQKSILAVVYKNAYQLYTDKQYQKTIQVADSILIIAKDKQTAARFDYLRALSIGKMHGKDSLVDALSKIVTKYPETDVKTEAQSILDFFTSTASQTSQNDTPKDSVDSKTPKGLYKFDPTSFHFYIVIFNVKNISINQIKIAYSNHNTKYFSPKKLNTNSLFLDDTHEMINIGRFENKNEAQSYLNSIVNSPEITNLLDKTIYYQFVISAENYPVFYKSKDIEKYDKFFKDNYLKP